MSKSNDVSTPDHRPLADSELDAVSGGFFGLSAIADALADAADLTADSWSGWPIGW